MKRKGKGPVYILQGMYDESLHRDCDVNPLRVGYGLTETSPTTHITPIEGAGSHLGSIGVLLPNLEARLIVDGDGNGEIDTAEGQPGEIWLRGPTVMKVRLLFIGYRKNSMPIRRDTSTTLQQRRTQSHQMDGLRPVILQRGTRMDITVSSTEERN